MKVYHGALGLSFVLVACGADPKRPATVEATETPTVAASPTSVRPATAPSSAAPAVAAAPVVAAPAPKRAAPSTERAQSLLAQAQAAAVDEDLATARSHLEAAIADSPGLAPAHYNLGVISEWMGRTATAKKHYQQALQADPEFMSAVVASARLMVREGNTAGGIAFAQQQSARLPDSLPLANAYDRIRLLKPGQASSVIASAKKVLRRDEKNAAAMANLAQAYHQQGKYELAIAILGNAQVIEADNPELLMLQALAHDKLEEPMRARLALEKAIGLPGGASAEAYNNLGLIYYKAGDFQGAEAQFRKALARWPNMLAANVNLGNALKSQKRFVEGESALKRAITIDPNNADVYYNLGILYLDGDLSEMSPIKRLEAALGYFEQYKQKSKAVDAKDPVVQYMEEARKRIDVEKKRAEQMRRAAKQPAAAPATTDEGGAE